MNKLKKDIIFISSLVVILLPFGLIDPIHDFYISFNREHGIIMSFIKFALLSTIGESIGLRIKKGVYNEQGFGFLPRAVVWGFLGVSIKLAFIIFANGTPMVLEYIGIEGSIQSMHTTFSFTKLTNALAISTFMNLFFAPVFMTCHKITDIHIVKNGGTIKGLFTPIRVSSILQEIDWKVHFGFVLKKTIPFFWIPAHTVTFLLPPEQRILMAALLGVVLGIILSVASQKAEPASVKVLNV